MEQWLSRSTCTVLAAQASSSKCKRLTEKMAGLADGALRAVKAGDEVRACASAHFEEARIWADSFGRNNQVRVNSSETMSSSKICVYVNYGG